MRLGLAEIFEKVSKISSKKEKIEFLQKNDSRALQDLIQYALHPLIKWDLPEGAPPYKPCQFVDQHGMLYSELRRLRLFVNSNGSNLNPTKLQSLFIEILECVEPKDAELLLLVKEKKLPKGVTLNLIEEVWPGLIPDVKVQEVS